MSQFTRMPQFIKDAYTKYCHSANRGGSSNAIIAGGAIRDTLNGVWIKDIDIFVDAKYAHEYNGEINGWQKVGRGASKLFDRFGDALPWQPSSAKPITSMSIPYSSTNGSTSVYMNNMAGTITFSSANVIVGMEDSSEEYLNNRRVVEVYERHDSLGSLHFPFDLLFTECPPAEYVTKYFDFGICKTWYDGSYVHMHGDYTNDVNNKTITMVLPEEHIIACYGSVAAGISAMNGHAYRIERKYPSHKIVMPSV